MTARTTTGRRVPAFENAVNEAAKGQGTGMSPDEEGAKWSKSV